MTDNHSTESMIENIAISIHYADGDPATVKWAKQSGKYRSSLRRNVRDVLAAIDRLGLRFQSPDKERGETPAPAGHVAGGNTYATAPIVLTEWERTRLAQHVSANALTYMGHHARGGLKPVEIDEMDRWKALADKLQASAAPKPEGSDV